MFSVDLGQEYRVNIDGDLSKGTQVKYRKDNYWYKEDNLGEEGVIEYLVSLILSYSNLPIDDYVIYEYGIINGKNGCRSVDFSYKGNFNSLERLHTTMTGNSLYEKVRSIDRIEDRVDYVLDFFKKYYSLDLYNYFRKVFSIDLITLNEDRHFNNLGVLVSGGRILEAPIFDNGCSLLNSNYSVNRRLAVDDNVKRVTAKPFSGSPDRQFSLFGCGFYLDYIGLLLRLRKLERVDRFYLDVLFYQLVKYRDYFCKGYEKTGLYYQGHAIGTRIGWYGRYYDIPVVLNFSKVKNMILKDGCYYTEDELNHSVKVTEISNSDVSFLKGLLI